MALSKREQGIGLEPIRDALGVDFLVRDEHWRIVLLHRGGRSLVKKQIAEMDRESRLKLLANLKVLAECERIRNPNLAKTWRGDPRVWELKAKAWRVMFFYARQERAIVLTNMVNKNAGEREQDAAFAICGRLMQETLPPRKPERWKIGRTMASKYPDIDLDALFQDDLENDGGAPALNLECGPPECDPEFVAEYAKTRFLEDLLHEMELQDLKPAALAKRLGKSRQYVSRILQEQDNFTIDTLAKLAAALGQTITLTLHDPREQVHVLPRCKDGGVYRFAACGPVRLTVEHFDNCIALDETRPGAEHARAEFSAA